MRLQSTEDGYDAVSIMKFATLSLAVGVMMTMSSCSLSNVNWPLLSSKQAVVRRAIYVQPADASQSPLYVYSGVTTPGPVSAITIDLSDQKAYVFKNGQQVGWTYVATGKSSHPTPKGSFVIKEKIADKRSNLYGVIVDRNGNVVNSDAKAGVSRIPPGGKFVGAKMPYWMRLTNYGVGMHSGRIPNPGSPASHGCIRLPYSMAETLFSEVPSGTRVTIVQ